MTEPWATLVLAFVTFAASDIDDLLLLTAFFADPRLDRRSIVLGQFLGIGALFLASAIAARLALGIPGGWIALLGLAPLFLGLLGLWRLMRGDDDDEEDAEHAKQREAALEVRLRSQALAVASVTVANGGDNLAVYVPVFAATPGALGLFAVVCLLVTAAWCAAGYLLVNNRLFG